MSSVFTGLYASGETLRIEPVELRVEAGRLYLTGASRSLDFSLADIRSSDRLGRVPRFLYLPNRGTVETGDHRAVLAALGRIRGMQHQEADPLTVMTIYEALKINRRIPGALTPVTERNCTGGGQARPGETEEFIPGSQMVTPFTLCRSRVENAARNMVQEMRAQNRDTLAAMDSLLEGLRDFEARKTLVYISNGIVFDFETEEFTPLLDTAAPRLKAVR